jgi:membrane fusion protein (multidrug efflux system)
MRFRFTLRSASLSSPAAPTSRHPMNIGQSLKVLARNLSLAGILCMFAACRGQVDAPQTAGPDVDVMTLQPQSIALITEVPGHTSAFLTAEVRPQVSGTILRRDFREGTDVKAGQLLYQIDPQTYQVVYYSDKAALSLAEAIAARQRSGDLRATEQQDDDADVEHKLEQADVVAARAALDRARTDLVATRITAPISGRIGVSTITTGAYVTAGQPTALATILQLDPMYVDLTLSPTDIQHVMRQRASGEAQQAGVDTAEVGLRLSDGTEYAYTGKLQFSAVPPPAGTESVTVRAVFPNPDGLLLAGMSVHAQLREGVRTQAVLVPRGSVICDTTGHASVLVVGSSTRVEVRPITIEFLVGDQWLIGSGLKAGDRIVVDALQRVRPSITVAARLVSKQVPVADGPLNTPDSLSAYAEDCRSASSIDDSSHSSNHRSSEGSLDEEFSSPDSRSIVEDEHNFF